MDRELGELMSSAEPSKHIEGARNQLNGIQGREA